MSGCRLIVFVLLAGSVSCGSARPAVSSSMPAVAPSTAVTNDSCVIVGRTRSTAGTGGLVTVDEKPLSLVAVWEPGFNDRPCRSVLMRAASALAQRIAADIRSAPVFPKGRFSCPADDASGVRLYFRYAGDRVEQVEVSLRGCAPISAPGRSPRRATQALLRDLLPIAPQPWHDGIKAFWEV